MSIFEIQEAAQKNNDIEAYAATIHDDFEFINIIVLILTIYQ